MGLHMGGRSAELKRLAALHFQWVWRRRSAVCTHDKVADKAMGGTRKINGTPASSRWSVGQPAEAIEKASRHIVFPFLCLRVAAPKRVSCFCCVKGVSKTEYSSLAPNSPHRTRAALPRNRPGRYWVAALVRWFAEPARPPLPRYREISECKVTNTHSPKTHKKCKNK